MDSKIKKTIKQDKKNYKEKSIIHNIYMNLIRDQKVYYKKNIIIARKYKYYKTNSKNIFLKILYQYKFNKASRKINIYLQGNFGENIKIYHQNIILNQYASIGNNVIFHGNNCIGNDGINEKNCPTIGDNVDIGYGATIIGKIKIADNVVIGANSVVTKDITESNSIVAGCPAKIIRKK